jgi:putative transposase
MTGRSAVSTGSRGDAYDNAVTESFFARPNMELIRWPSWPTRHELIGKVFDHIEAFYGPTRRHSTLGYLSPAQCPSLAPKHERMINTQNAT